MKPEMAGNRSAEEVHDFASSLGEAMCNAPMLMRLINAANDIDKLI